LNLQLRQFTTALPLKQMLKLKQELKLM